MESSELAAVAAGNDKQLAGWVQGQWRVKNNGVCDGGPRCERAAEVGIMAAEED